jgi:hypothetical protein
MVQLWISHEGTLILCLGLLGRPFSHYCVLPWNLACVPFVMMGFWHEIVLTNLLCVMMDSVQSFLWFIRLNEVRPCIGLIWAVK